MSYALLGVIVCVVAFAVLPQAVEIVREARAERLAREEHERLTGESRRRQVIQQADLLRQQEEAKRISEENLRLSKEIQAELKKMKKGE